MKSERGRAGLQLQDGIRLPVERLAAQPAAPLLSSAGSGGLGKCTCRALRGHQQVLRQPKEPRRPRNAFCPCTRHRFRMTGRVSLFRVGKKKRQDLGFHLGRGTGDSSVGFPLSLPLPRRVRPSLALIPLHRCRGCLGCSLLRSKAAGKWSKRRHGGGGGGNGSDSKAQSRRI